MPCYESPPPWVDEYRKNAESAVKILCKFVGDSVKDNDMTTNEEMLRWFIQHKKIDEEIASTPYYSEPDPLAAAEAVTARLAAEVLLCKVLAETTT